MGTAVYLYYLLWTVLVGAYQVLVPPSMNKTWAVQMASRRRASSWDHTEGRADHDHEGRPAFDPHLPLPAFDPGSVHLRVVAGAHSVELAITETPPLSVVWESGALVCSILQHAPFVHRSANGLLRGIKLLDLGAGTGISALCAAALGADVVATEMPHALPTLARNFEANVPLIKDFQDALSATNAGKRPGCAECTRSAPGCEEAHESQSELGSASASQQLYACSLPWSLQRTAAEDALPLLPPYDIVVAADTLYPTESHKLLVATLARTTGAKGIVLLVFPVRTGKELNFLELAYPLFRIERIDTASFCTLPAAFPLRDADMDRLRALRVYVLTRRAADA